MVPKGGSMGPYRIILLTFQQFFICVFILIFFIFYSLFFIYLFIYFFFLRQEKCSPEGDNYIKHLYKTDAIVVKCTKKNVVGPHGASPLPGH